MQGYVKDLNFEESKTADSDRRILDNLAGAGISSDIALFSNNLRNVSTIFSTDYVIENNQFVITNPFVFPYANNNIVIYNGVEYIVKNSDLNSRFQLYPIDNLNSPFVPNPPYQNIIRNDKIRFENIINLNPQRLETKPTSTLLSDTTSVDPYTVYPINENIEAIEQATEIFEYKKESAIVSDRENFIESPVTINGTVVITNLNAGGDPSNDPFDSQTDPGMFISNGTNKIRAFSDSTQPWTKVTGGLSTNSVDTNLKNLIVSNLELQNIQVTEITTENINTSLKNVYFAVPININGETYSLLCRKTT